MARNLAGGGHELVAVDADPARAALLGTPVAATPAEAAEHADVAFLSLPSPAAVEDVALGPAGVRAGARRGFALVDLSTGPPALARTLAGELGRSGIDSLDAPVSGGPHGAEDASLTVMAGGSREAFAAALPLLELLGSLVVHVGPAGAGQAAKLCNNLIAGTTMAAIAEACELAEREGIDPAVFYRILAASTGDSRVLRTRFPLPGASPDHPASRDFEPLFALDLMAKDLALALELAAEHGVEATVATAGRDRFRAAQERGLGTLDYSAVYAGAAPVNTPSPP
jgi:3-hydroxyisobutyrate dehydrogenase